MISPAAVRAALQKAATGARRRLSPVNGAGASVRTNLGGGRWCMGPFTAQQLFRSLAPLVQFTSTSSRLCRRDCQGSKAPTRLPVSAPSHRAALRLLSAAFDRPVMPEPDLEQWRAAMQQLSTREWIHSLEFGEALPVAHSCFTSAAIPAGSSRCPTSPSC